VGEFWEFLLLHPLTRDAGSRDRDRLQSDTIKAAQVPCTFGETKLALLLLLLLLLLLHDGKKYAQLGQHKNGNTKGLAIQEPYTLRDPLRQLLELVGGSYPKRYPQTKKQL
jgi:hypothetical protein